eukprot:Gb_36699 [translate_table: standard]
MHPWILRFQVSQISHGQITCNNTHLEDPCKFLVHSDIRKAIPLHHARIGVGIGLSPFPYYLIGTHIPQTNITAVPKSTSMDAPNHEKILRRNELQNCRHFGVCRMATLSTDLLADL